MYNVPIETLRRRVVGSVSIDGRPGPPTILTVEEEDRLCKYIVEMADIGFGLTREEIAFRIVDEQGRKHPFRDGMAGRGWFEGFRARHSNLTIRTPQALSSCRARCSNQSTIEDFFAKLGGLYGRLNVISKPMQVYNVDESGVSVVHKPCKVVGRRKTFIQ